MEKQSLFPALQEAYETIKKTTDIVEEGWLDTFKAKRAGTKSVRAMDKENKAAQKTALANAPKARRIEIGPDGKGRMGPLVGPTKTEPVHSDDEKRLERFIAMSRSLSASIYRDLKRAKVITNNDPHYKSLIDNFIRVVYVLSNYDTEPNSQKPFTWTRVDRNLIGRYLRPMFEAIVDNKISGTQY